MARVRVRKRGKTWQWEWTPVIAGERQYHSRGGYRTKAEALEDGEEYAKKPTFGDKTVKEVYADWINGLGKYKTYNTVHAYHTAAKGILRPVMDERISDLQGEFFLSAADNFTGGESNAKIKLAAARSFGSYCYSAGYWDRNRADGMMVPNDCKKPTPHRVLTHEEEKAAITAAKGTWLYVPMVLQLYGGLRIGEALGLERRDIDGNKMYIHQQFTREKLKDSPKTDAGTRTVPLPAEIRFYTGPIKQIVVEGKIYNTPDGDRDFVCRNGKGNFLRTRTLENAYRALGFSSHDLRKTCSTRLLDAGVDLPVVAALMGHDKAIITLRSYYDVDFERMLDADKMRTRF